MDKKDTAKSKAYDEKEPAERRSIKRPATAPFDERLSANRKYIPVEIRRKIARTNLSVHKLLQSLDKTIGHLNKQEQGQALINLLNGEAVAPKTSKLYSLVELVKTQISTYKTRDLKSLDQVAQGKTAKVLLDTNSQCVYKIIEVRDGMVGGTFPQSIRHRKEDDQILISGCLKHPLIECLTAVFIANNFPGPLLTEFAGITENKDIVLKQPYIPGLHPIEIHNEQGSSMSQTLKDAVETIGLKLISDIGSPFAVCQPNKETIVLFDDLHGENLLLDGDGTPILVDSLATRHLNPSERNLIQSYCENHNIPLSGRKPKGRKNPKESQLEI
jgi:hypothetical protein